jgi:DNA-directed RNA polymerase subunit RPC12/RpoP
LSLPKQVKASLFCPNCGHKIIGTKGDDGSLRIQCDRCKVAIFSKPKGSREINIKMVSLKAV